jgi:hypothetical protein
MFYFLYHPCFFYIVFICLLSMFLCVSCFLFVVLCVRFSACLFVYYPTALRASPATVPAMETLNIKKGILPVSCTLPPFFFSCTPCLRGNSRHFFFWLLSAKTLAIVLCTLVKFCTFSSSVLVDFWIIWALFFNFCLLFGSFWRSCGSPDHFLRAWGGLGALGAQRSEKGTWRTPPLRRVTFWSPFANCSQKSELKMFCSSL